MLYIISASQWGALPSLLLHHAGSDEQIRYGNLLIATVDVMTSA